MNGAVHPSSLLFTEGQQVKETDSEFRPDLGPIQYLFDDRDSLWITLPGGERRMVRVKYMDTTFHLMFTESHLVVQCRYYDGSDFAGFRTVFYDLPIETLAFPGGILIKRLPTGEIDDWFVEPWHDIVVQD